MALRQRLESLQQVGADIRGIVHEILPFDDPERRERGRAGQRMARVGVAVRDEPCGRGDVERFGNAGADRGRAQRHITGRQALGETGHVGFHPPAAGAEQAAAAPEPGDHLVGDQQHVVRVADFPHQRPVIRRRHDDAARPLYGLGDERGDILRAQRPDLPVQDVGAYPAELLGVIRPGIPVRKRVGDLRAPRQERMVGLLERRHPVQRRPPEMHPVIPALKRNEPRLRRLPARPPELARQLERRLHGIRSPQREEDLAHVLGLEQRLDAGGQPCGRFVGEFAERAEIGEPAKLAVDGFAHLLPAVPDVHAPQPAHPVEIPPAGVIVDMNALPAGEKDRLALMHGRDAHGMQYVVVEAFELGILSVRHGPGTLAVGNGRIDYLSPNR